MSDEDTPPLGLACIGTEYAPLSDELAIAAGAVILGCTRLDFHVNVLNEALAELIGAPLPRKFDYCGIEERTGMLAKQSGQFLADAPIALSLHQHFAGSVFGVYRERNFLTHGSITAVVTPKWLVTCIKVRNERNPEEVRTMDAQYLIALRTRIGRCSFLGNLLVNCGPAHPSMFAMPDHEEQRIRTVSRVATRIARRREGEEKVGN